MSSAVITAGQTRINELRGLEQPLVLDKMVFALIPDLDETAAVDRAMTMPPSEQIVHEAVIDADHKGYVGSDQVVYSVILGSDIGDWSFNMIGLVEAGTGNLIAVSTMPETPKRATNLGNNTTGNMITRNFVLAFVDAQNLTGITVSAETWQFDYLAEFDLHASQRTQKQLVRVVATSNINMAGEQTIDGVDLVAGDRALVVAQDIPTENGPYIVSAAGWSRSTDADTAGKLAGAIVPVAEGTGHADSAWVLTSDAVLVLGDDDLVWSKQAEAGVPDKISHVINQVASLDRTDKTQLLTSLQALGLAAANESFAGLLEIATALEVLAGTDNTRAVTPAGLAASKSLAVNGYYKLPGGLIIQWGKGTAGGEGLHGDAGVVNVFPVSFPTAAVFAVGIHRGGNPTAGTIVCPAIGTSSVSFETVYPADISILYLAIGY